MGGGSSKQTAVKPEPISTTVTVLTTVHTTEHTTEHTTVLTTAAEVTASEVRCWAENHEILYISLAFISGILLAALVFAIICLIRKKCKRSYQNLQGRAPSQTATEESARNSESEVAYTTVIFQRNRTPVAV
ncbi:transmembrane protein C1orf162 homolog isoform 1-T1 [Chlamydotis macqueenii]